MSGLDEKRLTHLFTTPVLLHHWSAGDLNSALKDVVLERERTDRGVDYSNVGGWHSTADFEDWSGEPGKRLVEMVGAQVNRATAE